MIIAHSARRGVGSAVNVLRQADARLLAQAVNAGRQLGCVVLYGIGCAAYVVMCTAERKHRRLVLITASDPWLRPAAKGPATAPRCVSFAFGPPSGSKAGDLGNVELWHKRNA